MLHTVFRPSLGLLALLLSTLPLAAQNPPPDPQAAVEPAQQVAAELVRLNDTLERLEALLERQLQGKKVELTMKRVDSLTRSLESMDGQVLAAQERRRGLEETLRNLEQERQQIQIQLDSDTLDISDPQIRAFYTVMEQRIQDHRQRIAQADREIAELEGQRDALQKEVLDWQDYIDRQISDL